MTGRQNDVRSHKCWHENDDTLTPFWSSFSTQAEISSCVLIFPDPPECDESWRTLSRRLFDSRKSDEVEKSRRNILSTSEVVENNRRNKNTETKISLEWADKAWDEPTPLERTQLKLWKFCDVTRILKTNFVFAFWTSVFFLLFINNI
jgi:hypothetical protein